MRDTRKQGFRYQFQFDWRMTLFTLFFLPLLVSLGFWQLNREQQKIAAEDLYKQRLLTEAADVASIDWNKSDLNWVSVSATGFFDKERHLLLDNRIHNSVVGYEVITPFFSGDKVLLINRGWIAQGPSRQSMPSVEASDNITTISGHIYVPDGSLMMLGSEEFSTENWPKVVQKIDFQYISGVLDESLVPHVIRLDENSPGVLQTNWSAINMKPEVHKAYAVQWFIMALVLFILYLFFSIRKSEK